MLLSILGYVLLVIGLVLGTIIIVPYNYYVSGEYLDEALIQGSLSWLFGGVKMDFYKRFDSNMAMGLTIFGFNKKIKSYRGTIPNNHNNESTGTEPSKKRKTVRSKRLSSFGRYFKRNVIQKAISAILKLVKHCQPKILSIQAKIGFIDPMYTGLLYAFNSQFYPLLNRYDIHIQPVFDEEIVEGRFLIGGRIWLPYLILVMIRFLITQPIRNIFISNFRSKIKGGFQYVR